MRRKLLFSPILFSFISALFCVLSPRFQKEKGKTVGLAFSFSFFLAPLIQSGTIHGLKPVPYFPKCWNHFWKKSDFWSFKGREVFVVWDERKKQVEASYQLNQGCFIATCSAFCTAFTLQNRLFLFWISSLF